MKRLSIIAILWLICYTSYSQTSIISGRILDKETKEPLAGVTISILHTNIGSITNTDGSFSLTHTEPFDSIEVRYLGYITQRAKLEQSSDINIELEASSTTMQEVVVTAGRNAQKRSDVPIAISKLSNAIINATKPTSIDQVLNQTPGVNMVNLGSEQHTMSIRRPIDYGASYLYLEDGVPIRTSGVFNHNALLEINMANTKNIEIIRGPASSMYGSEAIGGVVNFISKKASALPDAGISVQANDIGYKRTDFYVSNTFSQKLGIRLAGYYANQKDGTVAYSDFDKLALSLSANYYISDKTELTWTNSLIDYYADMSGSLDSSDFYSESYSSNQTFTNRKVSAYRNKLVLNRYWNEKSKSTITGYFRANSIKQNPSYRVRDDFKPWIPSGDRNIAHGEINDNSFKSYGIITQHKQEINWLNSSVVVGSSLDFSPNTYQASYIDIHKSDDGVYDSFTNTDSLLADYNADLLNFAAYAQIKIQPFNGLNVIGAIRYDHFKYVFDNNLGSNAFTAVLDGENTFSQFTPKIGMTYDFKNNRGIYANYSRGFVPPQVTELYRGNQIPSLKPVYYNNYEIGGWIAMANEKSKLELSFYKMDGLNEIISVLQNDGSTIRQNVGETTHQGIEYSLNIFPHRDLAIRLSGTNALHEFVEYNESGNDYSGNKMPQAPQWITNSQISYKPAYINGFRISLEWRHINEYYMEQQNTKTYEGYDVFNLRMGYEWKSFEVWTNLINATDKLYATIARSTRWGQTYSLGEPRNMNIGLSYKFQGKK